jgi:hypothetical protein
MAPVMSQIHREKIFGKARLTVVEEMEKMGLSEERLCIAPASSSAPFSRVNSGVTPSWLFYLEYGHAGSEYKQSFSLAILTADGRLYFPNSLGRCIDLT